MTIVHLVAEKKVGLLFFCLCLLSVLTDDAGYINSVRSTAVVLCELRANTINISDNISMKIAFNSLFDA